jgi:hypothetical protein
VTYHLIGDARQRVTLKNLGSGLAKYDKIYMHRYVRRDPVSLWFTIDIERAMIERNIAYKVWRRRKTTLDRERYDGRSAHLFNLIIPSHRTSARASSFFVQGAILWNFLRSEERVRAV